MKAVVLEAEWAPRPGARISKADNDRQWAAIASEAYRNPSVEVRDVEDPGDPPPPNSSWKSEPAGCAVRTSTCSRPTTRGIYCCRITSRPR